MLHLGHIEALVNKTMEKVKHKLQKPMPSIKTKLLFKIMSCMQKSNNWNMTDKRYWEKNGWLNKSCPWR